MRPSGRSPHQPFHTQSDHGKGPQITQAIALDQQAAIIARLRFGLVAIGEDAETALLDQRAEGLKVAL
ncbi:MAG: hypothetical protein C1943_07755 [Halochromatium sp.]|nr:hypothetical protein [Halochromatium sp.]